MTGAELKEIRKQLRVTQCELASALCVTVRAVVSWETGTRNMPLCCWKLLCLVYGLEFRPPVKSVPDETPDLFPDFEE